MAKEERETIINFTEADDEAQIYTCNRKFKNKLRRMGYEPTEADAVGGELFVVPRNILQIRKPRELSDEDREEAKKRLKQVRKEKGIGEFAKKAGKKATVKPKKAAPAPVDDEIDEDEDEEDAPAAKPKKSKVKPVTKKPAKDEDEDEDDFEDEEDEDEDDDEEEVEVVKRKKPAKVTPAKAKGKAKK